VAANTGYLGGPIPIALLVGIYNQFIRPGHIGEMSLIGCVLLLVALVYGRTVAETPEAGFTAISPAHPAFAERAGSRDAVTKITDVHTDRLLPCQGSRTSRRRSHRSRKQNQPRFRRLRSERYPCQ
jgi:hypothetical protein